MKLPLTLAAVLATASACACGSKAAPEPAEPTPAAACITGGCSGTICQSADAEPVMTTCEFRAEYACYRDATCERQADGACGWTQTEELAACLASPPPVE